MDPYIILCCFYMNHVCFLHCFHMILDGCIHEFSILTYFGNSFYTYVITIVELFKDPFSSPPAGPEIGLIMQI